MSSDKEVKKSLLDYFRFLDKDSNGVLSFKEIEEAMKVKKYNDEIIQEAMNQLDLDKNGFVNFTGKVFEWISEQDRGTKKKLLFRICSWICRISNL